jgi:hypothetical protein
MRWRYEWVDELDADVYEALVEWINDEVATSGDDDLDDMM